MTLTVFGRGPIVDPDRPAKQAAMHDLNAALEEANVSVKFNDDERWVPFFTKIFLVLAYLVRKANAK